MLTRGRPFLMKEGAVLVSIKVILSDEIREITVCEGTLLSDALQSAGIPTATPCGGNGKCGKCRIRAAGALVPPPDGDGLCLACQTRISGPATVWPGESRPLQAIEGVGAMPDFPLHPIPGRFGLAVDIGTTTLAAQLVSLPDGRLLHAITSENPQRAIAHDVIGRIQASLDGKGAFQQELIVSELNRMLSALCARADIRPEDVTAQVCTGNTTMLYLLTGRSPASIATAPFAADCLFDLTEDGRYLPPCFGAYVGADIACALLASDMASRNRTAMLIDIGTNGEICLLHNGRITCCATAAGPAFEGAGISCGVSSVEGAIESVWAENGEIRCSTIGGAPPVGLCGSGLIDATAALLQLGLIDETGFMEDDEVELADGVSLSQKDVRMIQLAKGSICAGMRSLMSQAGISECDVEAVYIAGGFGRHINLANAMRIGLIPTFPAERVHVIGNAALTGSVMLLLDSSALERMRELVGRAECINLAQLPQFQILYPEAMLFPEE